jgi:ATP-binding protein involved in chromosome partitioning
VIVSTPQDVALADVRKGIAAFHKLSIPVRSLVPCCTLCHDHCFFPKTIGLVLNQSYFICPSCDTPHRLFGPPDAAMGLGVELLGELPLTPGVSTGGDAGLPYALINARSEADGVAGRQWREVMTGIAERVWEALHSDSDPGTIKVPR